jgi:hypothetical protein
MECLFLQGVLPAEIKLLGVASSVGEADWVARDFP